MNVYVKKLWTSTHTQTRGQFHQRSTRSFYIRKLRAKLFCAYVLALYFTGVSLPAQKLHVKLVKLVKLTPGVNFTNSSFFVRKSNEPLLCTKRFFRLKEIGAKAGHKLMVKLTIVQSLILPCCKVQSHHKEICLNVENFTKCLRCWIFLEIRNRI